MAIWRLIPNFPEGKELEYDDLALTLGETFDMKRLAGLSLADLEAGFRTQDPEAWRFVFYLACTRAGIDPGPYHQIDFAWRDWRIELAVDDDEEDEPVAEEDTGPDIPTGSTPDLVTTTGEPIPSE